MKAALLHVLFSFFILMCKKAILYTVQGVYELFDYLYRRTLAYGMYFYGRQM